MNRQKPNWRRILIVLGIVAAGGAGLLVCAAAVGAGFLLKRETEAPGEGAKAQRGYQACDPIIVALRQYEEDHGAYPEALAALVPGYLAEVPAAVNDWPIEYRLTDESYSLEFSYTGPGMNHCSYTPAGGWDCYGYY
jgi:hypothetical protein